MTSLDEQLASLSSMQPAQLRVLWRDVWRRSAPAIGPDLLRRGIAWKLQARIHGDLPKHVRREVDGVLTRLRRGDPLAPPRPSLRPGSRLVREWQGRTYQIVVLERGYEHDGRHFRSLTQIARAITGTHQSGTRFFGIRPRSEFGRTRSA
jgi:hypothetical protein